MRLLLGLALVPALVAGGAAGGEQPRPTVVPQSFSAVLRTARATERIAWLASGSFAARPIRGEGIFGRVWEQGGSSVVTYGGPAGASRFQRMYAARPDGYRPLESLRGASDFVLAQARAGRRILTADRLDGRAAWRARVPLRANDCAGLRSGSETLWLDRRTLLPLRVIERRAGRKPSGQRLVLERVNGPLAPGTFRPPRLPIRYRSDAGFRRTTPAEAARHLPYAARLPAFVPEGFSLAVVGWAPRSGITGAEGSNPRYRSLFAAVYGRGVEHIDLTQRLAGRSGWLGDPFGAECVFQSEERTRVAGVRARYGAGPQTTPHLWWRRGNVLLTVSGPFPKRTLVRIASSLRPVAR